MSFIKTISLSVLVAIAGIGTCAAQVKLDGPPKIAFIYVSPADDGGWSTSHDRGRQALEQATGFPTAFTESVPEEKSKVRQVIDAYASRGFNIIIGTSFGYGDAFQEAAKDYPNVAMMNVAGDTQAPNLESFFPRTYQAMYLAGMVAASMSKTDTIARVDGFPVPVANWDANAFARGAQAVKPNIKVIITYINSWYDPVKEDQAADAMIEQGADVILAGLSAAEVVEAEKKGVYSIGTQVDMSAQAPKGHLVSTVFAWDKYEAPLVESIVKGTWKSAGTPLIGMETGIVDLSPFNPIVPEEVRQKVAAARQAMIDGKLTPFDGPVYRQDGSLVVPEGRSMTDDELWHMTYLVKGITGSMPKQP